MNNSLSKGTKASAANAWATRKILPPQEPDVCRRVREAKSRQAKVRVINKIADEFKCSAPTVKAVLKRNGVGGWKKGFNNQSFFSKETKLEIVALFKTGSYTVVQLAKKYGSGTGVIYKTLNEHCVFKNNNTRKRQPNAKYTTSIDYPLAPGVSLNPKYKGID